MYCPSCEAGGWHGGPSHGILLDTAGAPRSPTLRWDGVQRSCVDVLLGKQKPWLIVDFDLQTGFADWR